MSKNSNKWLPFVSVDGIKHGVKHLLRRTPNYGLNMKIQTFVWVLLGRSLGLLVVLAHL